MSRAGLIAALAATMVAALPAAAPAQWDASEILRRALRPSARFPPRWPRAPLLDVAAPVAGLPLARATHGTSGRGAAICVLDTGLDVAHRDFLDADGRSRVRYLLDLSSAPRGGAHADLEARFSGAVWDGASLDAALATGRDRPRDPSGHGTAVASVAAGDDAGLGEAPGPRAGAAPEADLVVVRALRSGELGFRDEDIVAGVDFCAAVAGRGPSPLDVTRMVVVLALGGHDGAHDGSEPLDRALEARAAGGLLIVAAAGNHGDRPIHAEGVLREHETAVVELAVPTPEPGARYVALSLEAQPRVALVVVAPDGTRTPALDAAGEVSTSHAGGTVSVRAQERGDRGRRTFHAVLAGGGGATLGGGRYRAELRGPGSFDLWLADADLGRTLFDVALGGPFVEAGETVTVPATSRGVLAVGATVARAVIPTNAGEALLAGAVPLEVAPFSSRGPTTSGAPKPELVAPGGHVIAALSADVDPGDGANLVGGDASLLRALRVGDDRIVVQGTSFAAPLAAGALALGLALGPSRGQADRALLAATAAALEAGGWSEASGAGVLDAGAFLDARAARLSGPVRGSLTPTREAVSAGAADLFFVVRGQGIDDRPSVGGELALEVPDGRVLRTPLGVGFAGLGVPVPRAARPGELLVYRASLDDVALPEVRVRVRLDGARDRTPPSAHGGCSAAPSPGVPATPLGALLVLTVLVWGRRPPRRSPRRRAPDRGR